MSKSKKNDNLKDLSPAGLRTNFKLNSTEADNRETHRQLVIDAAAKVLVLEGYGPHAKAVRVNLLLPLGEKLHSDHGLRTITGGYNGLVKRMSKGRLFSTGELGRWTEGLIAGLRLSGALAQRMMKLKGMVKSKVTLGSWWVRPFGLRPALEKVLLGGLPFSCRARVGKTGVELYRFWAGNLGTEVSESEQLAGIFMGAISVRHLEQSWLGLPSTPEVKHLVESWGIPAASWGYRVAKRRVCILVSPFWGALFSAMMPEGMREWYLGMKKPGMCPLLPWAFLKMAAGHKSSEVIREGVPFLTCREAMYDSGLRVRKLHENGVRELGFTRLDPRLKEVWIDYMAKIVKIIP